MSLCPCSTLLCRMKSCILHGWEGDPPYANSRTVNAKVRLRGWQGPAAAACKISSQAGRAAFLMDSVIGD